MLVAGWLTALMADGIDLPPCPDKGGTQPRDKGQRRRRSGECAVDVRLRMVVLRVIVLRARLESELLCESTVLTMGVDSVQW